MSVQPSIGQGVSVVGEAASVVVPDAVELTVLIRAAGATVTQALREHANRTVGLMQTLTTKGLASGDVRTTGVTVVPVLAPQMPGFVGFAPVGMPGGYGEMPAPGYQATSTVKLMIHDPNRITELLDAVVAVGPHLVMELSQKLSDESAIRRSVLESAIKDARLKAQAIAAAMGKQLGDPISIVEDSTVVMNGSALPPGPGGAGPHQIAASVPSARASVRVSFSLR